MSSISSKLKNNLHKLAPTRADKPTRLATDRSGSTVAADKSARTAAAKSARTAAALFAGMGVLHFVAPKPFNGIIPPQLPGKPSFYTYASGVAELGVAGLLAAPRTRKLGGAAMFALLLAVWPANWYTPVVLKDKPVWAKAIGWARIPLQLPMLKQAWKIAR